MFNKSPYHFLQTNEEIGNKELEIKPEFNKKADDYQDMLDQMKTA